MRTSFSKIFKILLATFLGLVILAISLLPTWLSTDSGKNFAVDLINWAIPGTLNIEKLKLSWWSKQQVEGFSLVDEQSGDILSFKSLNTEAKLVSLVFRYYSMGKTSLIAPKLKLVEDINGELNLDKALSSKKKNRENEGRPIPFPFFKGSMHVEEGEISIEGPRIDPIIVSNLTATLTEKPLGFEISAKTQQGSIEGSLKANGSLGQKTHIQAKIDNFPVGLIDQLQETHLYTVGIGKTVSLDLELNKSDEKMELSAKVDGPNLKGTLNGSTHGEEFVLDPSSQLTFTVTPAFFSQLLDTTEWHLANKANLTLTLDSLSLPRTLRRPSLHDIHLSGKATLDRAELASEKAGTFSLNDFQATLTSNDSLQIDYSGGIQGYSQIEGKLTLSSEGKLTFSSVNKSLPIDLVQLFVDDMTYLKPVLGDRFDFSIEGTVDSDEINASLSLVSTLLNLQGHVKGGELEDFAFDLDGELKLSEKQANIYGPFPHVEVQGRASIIDRHFTIPRFNAQVKNPYWDIDIRGKLGEKGKPFDYSQTQLVATGTIFKLPLEDEFGEKVSLNEGTFFLNLDGAKNLIRSKATLSTSISPLEETRSLEATAEMKNFIHDGKLDFGSAEIEAKGDFADFPVILLNPLLGEKSNLTAFFGPSIDLHFTGEYKPAESDRFTLDLTGKATGFEANVALTLDENFVVHQKESATVHWEMTPVRYLALMQLVYPEQDVGFVLMQTAPVDLQIYSLTCPTTVPFTLNQFLCKTGFVGKVDFGTLLFKNYRTNETLTINNLSAEIQGEDFSKSIALQGGGDIYSPQIKNYESSGFTFDGKMLDFWTPEGKFNRSGLTVKGDVNLNLIPVSEITGVIPMTDETRKTVRAVLGPLVNGRLVGEINQLEGPITIDIQSTNLKAFIPAELRNGYLTLRKTVEAELTLTEEINEALLKDINPLLITGAWSDHPIRFYIDAEGFSIPIHDTSLKDVQVERAIVDFGKLRVRNGGDIADLMKFLKAKHVSPEGVMEAWFTPIFVSLKDGTAKYKRFDGLLAGNVHIAMWGKIDLIKDKVKMTLGISPLTLQKRLKIPGLSKQDMFQVKMRGSTSNLDLDWTSAYARIGIIITRTAGGLGVLIGGLLDQIVKALGEEPTPPPTTNPFPWEFQAAQRATEGIPQETAPTKPSPKKRRNTSN